MPKRPSRCSIFNNGCLATVPVQCETKAAIRIHTGSPLMTRTPTKGGLWSPFMIPRNPSCASAADTQATRQEIVHQSSRTTPSNPYLVIGNKISSYQSPAKSSVSCSMYMDHVQTPPQTMAPTSALCVATQAILPVIAPETECNSILYKHVTPYNLKAWHLTL